MFCFLHVLKNAHSCQLQCLFTLCAVVLFTLLTHPPTHCLPPTHPPTHTVHNALTVSMPLEKGESALRRGSIMA